MGKSRRSFLKLLGKLGIGATVGVGLAKYAKNSGILVKTYEDEFDEYYTVNSKIPLEEDFIPLYLLSTKGGKLTEKTLVEINESIFYHLTLIQQMYKDRLYQLQMREQGRYTPQDEIDKRDGRTGTYFSIEEIKKRVEMDKLTFERKAGELYNYYINIILENIKSGKIKTELKEITMMKPILDINKKYKNWKEIFDFIPVPNSNNN